MIRELLREQAKEIFALTLLGCWTLIRAWIKRAEAAQTKGSTMSIGKKELDYAKETGEAMEFLVNVVKDVKAGKDVGAIAAGSLQEFMTAIQGIDQVPAEAKASKSVVLATVGYHTGALAGAMIGE